eukprot:7714942-Karenia_brevis.AAC.1
MAIRTSHSAHDRIIDALHGWQLIVMVVIRGFLTNGNVERIHLSEIYIAVPSMALLIAPLRLITWRLTSGS